MSKRDRCQAQWVPVTGLLLCGLIASLPPVAAFAEGPRTGHALTATAPRIRVSARVLRGPEPLMQEFQNKLPLSPVQNGKQKSGVVNAIHSKPELKGEERRGFPFQQAILSREQMAQAVHWIEKHKSLSLATISPMTIQDGEPEEMELLKGRVAAAPPVPQNGIVQASSQQLSEGIKLRLSSSRSIGETLLKCEWDSKEFGSLRKFAFADSNGKKVAQNLPGPMKCARFRMESTVSDGQTLAVSGFSRNGGTNQAEAFVFLIDVTPVVEQ